MKSGIADHISRKKLALSNEVILIGRKKLDSKAIDKPTLMLNVENLFCRPMIGINTIREPQIKKERWKKWPLFDSSSVPPPDLGRS